MSEPLPPAPVPPRTAARDGSRRWVVGLAILLVVMTLSVLLLSIVGSVVQSGIRASVGGEAHWSKAQKNAVIHLGRYIETGDEHHWDSYLAEIAVIAGDSRARLELERPDPNYAVIHDGFVAGRNAPEDVPALIVLFRVFRNVSYIDQAIAIWARGDGEIAILGELADRIHATVQAGRTDELPALGEELEAANDRLSVLEADFSATLGEGARWAGSVLIVATAAFLAIVLVVAAAIGRFMLRRLRAADRATAATLRESEARLRLLVEHLPAIVWTTDADLRVTSVFGGGLERLGIDPESRLGRALPDALTQDEGTARRLAVHQAALAGDPGEYQFETNDRIVQVHVEPVRVGGEIVGVVGVGLDLTERIELESRLARSARMESLGRLAGGIAHDFNNLLTAITGYAELLLGSLPPGGDRRDVEEIQLAASRAADLTKQLLAVGRRSVLQPELVSPNEVIAGMEQMVGRLIGEDIALELDLDPFLPSVMADPGQLEQVILNLAVNARDAMPSGGRLRLTTRRAGTDRVLLSVEDTGIGMDEPTQGRIFEPFFTTKPQGRGTGLGLASVYGIVEQSGGTIAVESTPGAGTTFSIELPAAADDGPAEAADGDAGAPDARPRRATAGGRSLELVEPMRAGTTADAIGAGTDVAAEEVVDIEDPATPDDRPLILVAEDEPAVRALVRSILAGIGYEVLVAVDGNDALHVADRAGRRIDVLVTDVIMPGLGGPELAARLTAADPGLAVLFMTGYSGDMLGDRGVIASEVDVLSKPFSPSELRERVRTLVARRRGTDVA